jgi:hypothetical protein
MVHVEVDGYEATVKFKIGYMPITKAERKDLGEPETWIQMPGAKELAEEGICLTSLLYSNNAYEFEWYHTELSGLNGKLKGKLKWLHRRPLNNPKAFLVTEEFVCAALEKVQKASMLLAKINGKGLVSSRELRDRNTRQLLILMSSAGFLGHEYFVWMDMLDSYFGEDCVGKPGEPGIIFDTEKRKVHLRTHGFDENLEHLL